MNIKGGRMKQILKSTVLVILMATLWSCQLAQMNADSQKANQQAEAKSAPVVSGPVDIGKEYYEANRQRDYPKVASLVSDYSLTFLSMTREGVQSTLAKKDAEGWRILDYRVLESKAVDPQKTLIHVQTKETAKGEEGKIYDFWGALRQENGQWRMNIGALIDDMPLNLKPQTYKDVTVQPQHIIRYVDKMRLVLAIENNGERGCFWGWGDEPMARIHFRQNASDVTGSVKVDPKKSYKDAFIDIKGFYPEYPVSIELVKWQWADKKKPDKPEKKGDLWFYNFTIQ